MKSTLIIGGARSGKSSFAQELALRQGGSALFVATATAGDEEMSRRIKQHQAARPTTWDTLEATSSIGKQIPAKVGQAQAVIIDCITLLVNNIFGQYSHQGEQIDADQIERAVTAEIEELMDCINRLDAYFIIVTNELGTGLVPPSRVARLYRDLLGKANQMLAAASDEVFLMMAGVPVKIKQVGGR